MHDRKPDPSKQLAPLDFEVTDLADARHALDELPPGITEVQAQQPGFWEQRRRRPTASDRALTGAAMDWVVALPPSLRPRELCERFPRVANELAGKWADRVACDAYFESLLVERRRNRQGFPPEVRAEIERLRDHRARSGS